MCVKCLVCGSQGGAEIGGWERTIQAIVTRGGFDTKGAEIGGRERTVQAIVTRGGFSTGVGGRVSGEITVQKSTIKS